MADNPIISDEEAQARLKDMFPEAYALNAEEPKSSVTVESAPAYGPWSAGATGAVVGTALGKTGITALPNEPNTSGRFKTANIRSTVLNESADRALNELENLKTAHAGTVDTAFGSHLNAQAELENALKAKLEAQALHNEVMPSSSLSREIPVDTAGAKWGDKINLAGTPAVADVRGAAILGNQARDLPPSVAEKFNLTNLTNRQGQGILVPNTVDTNYLTPAQQSAKEALASAEARHAKAVENAAKTQYELEKLRSSISKPVAMAQRAFNSVNERATQAARAAEELAPEATNIAKQAGKFVGKLPIINTVAGGLGGYQTMQGVENWNKGNKLEGAMDVMGGVGGGLMLYPHPYAKAAGAVLSAPPLAYEAYKLITEK